VNWLWGRIHFELFDFSLPVTIPPLHHVHLSLPHEVYDSPDQAAHFHILCTKLEASSLTQHLAYLRGNIVYFLAWMNGDNL
jgi:hypothetical protein